MNNAISRVPPPPPNMSAGEVISYLEGIRHTTQIEKLHYYRDEWLYPMGLGLAAGVMFATLLFLGIHP